MAAFSSGALSKVELSISCSDLRLQDSDQFFKSDPMVVVSLKKKTSSGGTKFNECARTEWQQNTLSPTFGTKIILIYEFERTQELKFSVYDLDTTTCTNLLFDDEDLVGSLECTLGELVVSSPMTRTLTGGSSKKSKNKDATITVEAKDASDKVFEAEVQFAAEHLDKKDFLGKSDPYLEICRMNLGNMVPVYSTEVVKNTLNPTWQPIIMNSHTLCNNEVEAPVRVACYDWDPDGRHDLIGWFDTTFAELQSGENLRWDCINEQKKQKKKKYKNSGVISIVSVKTKTLHSFLEYLMGGCQVSLAVGVDFTTCNKLLSKPNTLHSLDPEIPNQYINTLVGVGDICQYYDRDKVIPAFGFGGKIYFKTCHDFPLDRDTRKSSCLGLEGVLKAYHSAVGSVSLGEPKANVIPIINHVAGLAAKAKNDHHSQQYFILLLMLSTDVSDIGETKRAIIAASHLPMSVIMVGVGATSFIYMDPFKLESSMLADDDEVADRNIVQFVTYRKFHDAEALANAVLAEIPAQLTEYMNKHNISPHKL